MELFHSMILNTTLLISVGLIGGILFDRFQTEKLLNNILYGVLLGAVGVLLVINTVNISPGLFLDARSILVSVTGLFFGLLPTSIVVLIVSSFRIYLGGAGTITGVLIILVSAAMGLIWKQYRLKKLLDKGCKSWKEFYLFGLLVHIMMLLCIITLPDNAAFHTLQKIGAPVIAIFPFGTLLLSIIIVNNIKIGQTESVLKESELKFSVVIEEAPIGISISRDDRIIIVNKAFERIICRSKKEMDRKEWAGYTHPDDLDEDLRQYQKLQAGELEKYSMQKRYIRPDGSFVWVSMLVTTCYIEGSRYVICMAQDITEAKEAEAKLQYSETEYKALYQEYKMKQSLLHSLLNSIPDMIFYKDPEGVYMGCNKAFASFVGLPQEAVVGLTDIDLFDPSCASLFQTIDLTLMGHKSTQIYEEECAYRGGDRGILETLKTPYYDRDGNFLGLIGISRDITERKEREREIQYLSSHDALTGVFNRAYFDREFARQDASGQLPYSVILGDINGLKIINDIWGHGEGDRMIQEAADLLMQCCRPKDTLARIGGDEFAILLPHTDEHEVKLIYNQIMDLFEENAPASHQDVYKISLSLGCATKSCPDMTKEKLLKIADDYMYRKKLLEQKSLHSSILETIKTTMFEKSSETEAHAERMADLSKQIGIALGLSENDLLSLELAATLHDIGKIGISKSILEKPEALTDEEWREMKKHPEIGYRIAQKIPELSVIADYILCHHERWDGKGYPQGLPGEDIPLISRIIAVVDSYDAMTETRAYRPAITKEAAALGILNNSGTQFDPMIAATFVHYVLAFPKEATGQKVDDKEIAAVGS